MTDTSELVRNAIGRLKTRLLDLSGRNSLISFRHSERSRRQLRLVDIGPDTLYRMLEDVKPIEVLALPLPESEPEDEQTAEFLSALERGKAEDELYLSGLKALGPNPPVKPLLKLETELKDRVRTALGMPPIVRVAPPRDDHARALGINPAFDLSKSAPEPKKGKRQAREVQTLLYPEELDRKLGGVYEQAHLSESETGLNTLFAAFGFLEWYESDSSEEPIYSPLLLYPIEASRELHEGEYRYSIASRDEDLSPNICLQERLKRDFGIEPQPLEDEETPEEYLDRIERLISDKHKSWRIKRQVTIGFFSFAKLVMFHDLDPENLGEVDEGSTIAGLIAGEETEQRIFAEDREIDKPEIQAKIRALITDADASQLSALVDVIDGKNLVIEGPPGTGKSQTITNIIAAALADGRSVLFVAEKRAALEVVKSRLDKAGLGNFCLELHSNKTRKTDVLKSLERWLLERKTKGPGNRINAVLSDHQGIREQITRYVHALNSEFGRLDKTLHSIVWRFLRLRDELGDLPAQFDELRIQEVEGISLSQLETRKGVLDTLERHLAANLPDHPLVTTHPWHGLASASHGPVESKRLIALCETLAGQLGDLRAALKAPPDAHEWLDGEGLAEVQRALSTIISAADLLALPVFEDTVGGASSSDAKEAILRALDCYRKIQALDARLGAFTDSSVEDILSRHEQDIREAAQCLVKSNHSDRELSSLSAAIADAKRRNEDLAALLEFVEAAARRIHLQAGWTFENAQYALAAIQAAREIERDHIGLRCAPVVSEQAGSILSSACERSKVLRAKRQRVAEIFRSESEAPPSVLRAQATILQERSVGRFLKPSFWKGRGFYFSIARSDLRIPAVEMSVKLVELADYLDAKLAFETDAQVVSVCGAFFKGVDTAFQDLHSVNAWAQMTCISLPAFDDVAVAFRRVLLEGSLDEISALRAFADHPRLAQFGAMVREGQACGRSKLADLISEAADVTRLLGDARSKTVGLKGTLKANELVYVAEGIRVRKGVAADLSKNQVAQAVLKGHWPISSGNIAGLEATCEFVRRVHEIGLAKDGRNILIAASPREALDRLIGWARSTEQRLLEVFETISRLAAASTDGKQAAERFEAGMAESSPENLSARMASALIARHLLSSLTDYLKTEAEAEREGVLAIAQTFRAAGMPCRSLALVYEFSVLSNLLQSAAKSNVHFGRSVGFQFDELRRRFLHVDEQLLDLYRKQLFADLINRDITEGIGSGKASELSELGLIKHEISKQRKHVPIRALLSRAGAAVQEMKPCFMMSPLSVAQFIAPCSLTFDLVVMDEASQLRPEDAIGAVLRAKQVVVVGDPKQLPPTDFFSFTDQNGGLDEEDADSSADHESVLDLAIRSFQPIRRLKWHYRSRHQALIAYSNHAFYDQDLIVFPSPHHDHSLHGVKFVPVKGVYEKRRNMIEAQKIVEHAVEFMRRCPKLSLGLVAINQEQRDLITELIEHATKRDPVVQDYRARWENTLEPLFVKNLENVQGDERDAIFISTVYGPDGQGNFFQRFGPINGAMGHRRLNVLFTRAKMLMKVVSSIDPEKISVDTKSSRGLRALKEFLSYAQSGKLPGPQAIASGRGTDSDFEDLVRRKLTERGYEVDCQVGVAGYFIDLAVRHPGKSGTYLLGIECDGATYHSAKSARDRDKTRQEILENLGWKIHRIWSTDWFQHTDREIQKLLMALPSAEALKAEVPVEPEPIYSEPEPLPEQPELRDDGPSNAKPSSRPVPQIVEVLLSVMSSKAKMVRTRVIGEVAKVLRDRGIISFQRLREGGEAWAQIKSAINSAIRQGLVEGDQKYIWRTQNGGVS